MQPRARRLIVRLDDPLSLPPPDNPISRLRHRCARPYVFRVNFPPDVCREIVTKRTVSLAESVRVRGIPVTRGKGKGVAPERGGRIARKRASKKRLTKGKLAWKIGYAKLEGDRATKERSLGRGVKLRATRNIRDASGSRSRTCFRRGEIRRKVCSRRLEKVESRFFFLTSNN